ncbi:MAG: 8-amino-7-oxononanoate synthase [Verrucomicrobiota bacterium]
MSDFAAQLNQELEDIRRSGLVRELRRVDSPQSACLQMGGRAWLNFSSNDYLGLADHPALKAAASKAIETFGAGAGASRLICGSLAPHHELEDALAAFKGVEAVLSFSTGYAAAVGTITALLDKDDILILDKLVHASIVDAARLSGARLRVFAHNDLADLEKKLAWSRAQRDAAQRTTVKSPRVLVVTESVFSMDGDQAPLPELVALKNRYDAWLMVDEAHATGLFGARRSGLVEQHGLTGQVEIQMGTLGKALGASGGFIGGCLALKELLVNRARSFIYSTAPVPAAAAAARAAVELAQSAEGAERCATLWARVHQLHSALQQTNLKLVDPVSPILPLILGPEERAMMAAQQLREQGFFVPAIRYPTVARGGARLRVTLSAAHSKAAVQKLADALITVLSHS